MTNRWKDPYVPIDFTPHHYSAGIGDRLTRFAGCLFGLAFCMLIWAGVIWLVLQAVR